MFTVQPEEFCGGGGGGGIHIRGSLRRNRMSAGGSSLDTTSQEEDDGFVGESGSSVSLDGDKFPLFPTSCFLHRNKYGKDQDLG